MISHAVINNKLLKSSSTSRHLKTQKHKIYAFQYCTEQMNGVPAKVAMKPSFPSSEIPSFFPLTSKRKWYATLYTLLQYHNFSIISTIPNKSKSSEQANAHYENCGSQRLDAMLRICLDQVTLSELVSCTATGNKPDAFRKHPINLMCLYINIRLIRLQRSFKASWKSLTISKLATKIYI